jgi:hypothetical protein
MPLGIKYRLKNHLKLVFPCRRYGTAASCRYSSPGVVPTSPCATAIAQATRGREASAKQGGTTILYYTPLPIFDP